LIPSHGKATVTAAEEQRRYAKKKKSGKDKSEAVSGEEERKLESQNRSGLKGRIGGGSSILRDGERKLRTTEEGLEPPPNLYPRDNPKEMRGIKPRRKRNEWD